jgi:hypothetical protein
MTPSEELKIYRAFLHRVALLYDLGQKETLNTALYNVSRWSRSYRVGNGTLSEEEENAAIENAIRKLLMNSTLPW